jgi:hypothetical protein
VVSLTAGFGRKVGKLVKQRYMLSIMCGCSAYKLRQEGIVPLYRLTLTTRLGIRSRSAVMATVVSCPRLLPPSSRISDAHLSGFVPRSFRRRFPRRALSVLCGIARGRAGGVARALWAVGVRTPCRSAGGAERLADVQLSSRRRHRRFPTHQAMAATELNPRGRPATAYAQSNGDESGAVGKADGGPARRLQRSGRETRG